MASSTIFRSGPERRRQIGPLPHFWTGTAGHIPHFSQPPGYNT